LSVFLFPVRLLQSKTQLLFSTVSFSTAIFRTVAVSTFVPLVVLVLAATLPLHARETRGKLSLSPAALHFGDVAVDQSKTLQVSVTNNGQSSVTISRIASSDRKFSVSKINLPKELAAGRSLELTVTLTPTAKGSVSGSVTITSDASNPTLTLGVTGVGSAQASLTISPSTLSFGNVAVGATGTLTLGLSATGGGVTISSVSSSSSLFASAGADFPLTISSGKETFLNVTFTPKKDGEKTATLTFASNAANSPASESVTGTGTAPYVTLSWVPSVSEVTGYNVYRSKSRNGSYTKINSKLDPDPIYTDATIVSGNTYYYETTAVNSSGKESGYSNRAEVIVP
jgi:hypothetical protein